MHSIIKHKIHIKVTDNMSLFVVWQRYQRCEEPDSLTA
jgi:hypothetical protein